MATQDRQSDKQDKQDQSSNRASSGSDSQDDQNDQNPGIEHISRLTVQGIKYEAVIAGGGQSLMRVTVEDTVDNEEISPDQIEDLFQFFNTFYREQRRTQMGQSSGSGNQRGRVANPETDGRLKGNEAFRPNDPDRSKQAEGGARGGQSRSR